MKEVYSTRNLALAVKMRNAMFEVIEKLQKAEINALREQREKSQTRLRDEINALALITQDHALLAEIIAAMNIDRTELPSDAEVERMIEDIAPAFNDESKASRKELRLTAMHRLWKRIKTGEMS